MLFCSQMDNVDPKQRRASDGVLCVVKETDKAPSRGRLSPSLPYKLEPGAASSDQALSETNATFAPFIYF